MMVELLKLKGPLRKLKRQRGFWSEESEGAALVVCGVELVGQVGE